MHVLALQRIIYYPRPVCRAFTMTAPETVEDSPANNDLRLEIERLRRQVAQLENGDGDLPDQQYDRCANPRLPDS